MNLRECLFEKTDSELNELFCDIETIENTTYLPPNSKLRMLSQEFLGNTTSDLLQVGTEVWREMLYRTMDER